MYYLPDHHPIPEYRRYGVSPYGEIKCFQTNETVDQSVDRYGTVRATIKNDRNRSVNIRVAAVVLITYNPLGNAEDYGLASIIYRDGNKQNVALDNLDWELRGYVPHLIPGINLPPDAFVRIPKFSNYEIDISGTVRRHRNANVLKVSTNDGSYLATSLTDDNKIDRNVGVHRLLAMTFLPHPANVEHLTVNHKDGDKTNNNLWNLEWVSLRDNILHAERIGLRDNIKSHRVLAKNVSTEAIEDFKSLYECGDFFGVSGATIRDHLANPRGIRVYKGYYLKYAEDTADWPTSESDSFTSEGTPVLIKLISTGKVTRCRTMAEAAKLIGCAKSSVNAQAVHSKPRPYAGYLIRFDTPYVDWTQESSENLRRNSKIRIFNVTTNEETVWDNISSFCEHIAAPICSVHAAIKHNRRYRDYLIKYTD